MRQESFYIPGRGVVPRNTLLKELVAAIYNTAKENPSFTTNEVFAKVSDAEAVRKATANSKLIAVALRKAQVRGICTPSSFPATSKDVLSHGRRKARWFSKIVAPQYTG